MCGNIAITDDDLLEALEFFSVEVSTNDASVILPVTSIITLLRDSDRKSMYSWV